LDDSAAKDVWLQVGSIAEAKEALESKLVDVLVVQGEFMSVVRLRRRVLSESSQPFPSCLLPSSISLSGSEAGGHGLIASTPLNTLLSEVLALNLSSPSPILVVAAGGLMDGSDLAPSEQLVV